MNGLNEEKRTASEIAEQLIETQNSNCITKQEFLDTDLMRELDDFCFCCATCGWWCPEDEQAGENELGEIICDDCEC